MKSAAVRRRVWLPLLLALFSAIACIASLFKQIGLGELAVILVPLTLMIMIEGGRHIVGQFTKSYRSRS